MKSIYCYLIMAFCFDCDQALIFPIEKVAKLGHYGADRKLVSMSGLSSGAYMSVQYHVAFSSEIMGVGAIAGGLYYCANNNTLTGFINCAQVPEVYDVDKHINITEDFANSKLIDPTVNMNGDKVYIFHGSLDIVIKKGVADKLNSYYENYGCDIMTEYCIDAGHNMITEDYGLPCQISGGPPFINKCGYDAAYILLNHIYGNLTKPDGKVSLTGDLYQFDQSEFTTVPPDEICMDDIGYVYVPSYCKTHTGCRLHVVNHGCGGVRELIGDTYVRNAGYNDVAELNNIIVVYPQMVLCLPKLDSPLYPFKLLNLVGCHDWYGFTGPLYATKNGSQMIALHNMIERASSTE